MKIFARSDMMYVLLLAPFLVLAVYLSGIWQLMADPLALLELATLAGLACLFGVLRNALEQVSVVARIVAFFSFGVTVYAISMSIRGEEFELYGATIIGLIVMLGGLLPDRSSRKGKSDGLRERLK